MVKLRAEMGLSLLFIMLCLVCLSAACSRDGRERCLADALDLTPSSNAHVFERVYQRYQTDGIESVTLEDWKSLSAQVIEMETRQGEEIVPMALEALGSKVATIRIRAVSILARAPYASPVLPPSRWRSVAERLSKDASIAVQELVPQLVVHRLPADRSSKAFLFDLMHSPHLRVRVSASMAIDDYPVTSDDRDLILRCMRSKDVDFQGLGLHLFMQFCGYEYSLDQVHLLLSETRQWGARTRVAVYDELVHAVAIEKIEKDLLTKRMHGASPSEQTAIRQVLARQGVLDSGEKGRMLSFLSSKTVDTSSKSVVLEGKTYLWLLYALSTHDAVSAKKLLRSLLPWADQWQRWQCLRAGLAADKETIQSLGPELKELAEDLLIDNLSEMGPSVPYRILVRLGASLRDSVRLWEDEISDLRSDVDKHVDGWVRYSRRLEGLELLRKSANR